MGAKSTCQRQSAIGTNKSWWTFHWFLVMGDQLTLWLWAAVNAAVCCGLLPAVISYCSNQSTSRKLICLQQLLHLYCKSETLEAEINDADLSEFKCDGPYETEGLFIIFLYYIYITALALAPRAAMIHIHHQGSAVCTCWKFSRSLVFSLQVLFVFGELKKRGC